LGNFGTLSTPRAIGFFHGQFGITALPTLRKFPLQLIRDEDQFLLLACDGLWDVISTPRAAEFVNLVWAQEKENGCKKPETVMRRIIQTLTHHALNSTDNISIMLLRYREDPILRVLKHELDAKETASKRQKLEKFPHSQ